ncbi:MAG: glycosyltransferase family 1 protein [Burkholderiales bacterium]|jgi:glycosyltransferase involved in cell wall biosynthesis|nr:glycosyltransferase family 1 protein [Burkholderiales bacterium]
MTKKLLFIDNTAHHLYTQRHLYSTFANLGYSVVLCCPNDSKYFYRLEHEGYKCVPITIDGKSFNLLKNIILIWQVYRIFKTHMPDLVCSFTIKPNLFSALACKLLKIQVLPNITGLGHVFVKKGIVQHIITRLYKYAFANLSYIIFQNKDDWQEFIKLKILSTNTQVILVPGSGVDLAEFYYIPLSNRKEITFLYAGRLLWDKGIGELIDAFRSISKQYPMVKLHFIGDYFFANPSAISEEQMKLWQDELGIIYHGMVDNVPDYIAASDCVILPSYREGMPRSLLEASSMGRPIITVNSAGCKDVVEDGVTGFMAKVRDVDSLVLAMQKLINLPFADRVQLGLNGRHKMEREFDQKIVIGKYLTMVNQLL